MEKTRNLKGFLASITCIGGLGLFSPSLSALSLRQDPFQYSGQVSDAESKLEYLSSRYYHPGLMRFISRDTYPTSRKVNQDNNYNYAAVNPISNSDPSGHNATHAFWAGLFAWAPLLAPSLNLGARMAKSNVAGSSVVAISLEQAEEVVIKEGAIYSLFGEKELAVIHAYVAGQEVSAMSITEAEQMGAYVHKMIVLTLRTAPDSQDEFLALAKLKSHYTSELAAYLQKAKGMLEDTVTPDKMNYHNQLAYFIDRLDKGVSAD